MKNKKQVNTIVSLQNHNNIVCLLNDAKFKFATNLIFYLWLNGYVNNFHWLTGINPQNIPNF